MAAHSTAPVQGIHHQYEQKSRYSAGFWQTHVSLPLPHPGLIATRPGPGQR
ncbi:hypothetical protein EV679_0801 [Kerstersia gyiorum]|uniref:Uncharacterized protein n=1 Tax=Kerstersia gyiorum TaxID=206506 RepID=A0A4Q7MXS0_9BURK|nr:hypothetical protein [Kerstersia gyiorum]MCW2185296.1 hypothetical protein [Kerstersia gyiorum]RZS73603.1 hypothetical protein EV679_0801 [Kerstersia gyiorum]